MRDLSDTNYKLKENFMRNQTYLIVVVFLALISCRKEIDDGHFYITERSKDFLPSADSCIYISSDSTEAVLTKVEHEVYFEKFISDTDGQLFTR